MFMLIWHDEQVKLNNHEPHATSHRMIYTDFTKATKHVLCPTQSTERCSSPPHSPSTT